MILSISAGKATIASAWSKSSSPGTGGNRRAPEMPRTRPRGRILKHVRRKCRLRPTRLGRSPAPVAAVTVAVAVLVGVLLSRGNDGEGRSSSRVAGVVGADFHSLVADPTMPRRLFVGGHEAVSVSGDGGQSWSRLSSLDDVDAMGWGFTVGAVYVSGHPGIRRSTDGGSSFQPASQGLPDTDVHAFGASTSTLYAAGPANGVIASTDGGITWSTRNAEAGRSFFGRILTGPEDDQHLLAADARAGVLESTDGGRSWRSLGGPPGVVWLSRSGNTLYASGPREAVRSADGGRTWERLALPDGASLVEVDPFDPATLYTGVANGETVRVLVSGDSGGRWGRP